MKQLQTTTSLRPPRWGCALCLCLLLSSFLCTDVGAEAMQPQQTSPHAVGKTYAVKPDKREVFFLLGTKEETDPLRNTVFFGESTTAHLKNTGLLSTNADGACVLTTAVNTMMLTSKSAELLLCDPDGGECTLSQYLARRHPQRIILSFGLNGVIGFSNNPQRYLTEYVTLCESIHEASPETKILLQTVYPVAKNPARWSFSESPTEINRRITLLNGALASLVADHPAWSLVDTAALLTDGEGFLRAAWTTDGIHLTRDAYVQILAGIRGHLSKESNA